MNRRIVGTVLAVLAGIVLLAGVGLIAFHLGANNGNFGGRFVGPMGYREGYFGGAGLWFLGFIPMALIGLAVAWLIIALAGWGRGAPNHGHPAAPPPGAPFGPPPAQAPDGLERLKELSDLHDRGALNDEEFSAAKRKMLGL